VNDRLERELERLTANAALRREDLLLSGLRKSRRRKALNIVAGLLALTSAGAIAAVIADVFGNDGVQLIAAFVAGISGTISLVVTSYFSDDEILAMLTGSAKYLALRESVYRLVINPRVSDDERFDMLSDLQNDYAHLDETYSRYFSMHTEIGSQQPRLRHAGDVDRAQSAAREDVSELHRKLSGR